MAEFTFETLLLIIADRGGELAMREDGTPVLRGLGKEATAKLLAVAGLYREELIVECRKRTAMREGAQERMQSKDWLASMWRVAEAASLPRPLVERLVLRELAYAETDGDVRRVVKAAKRLSRLGTDAHNDEEKDTNRRAQNARNRRLKADAALWADMQLEDIFTNLENGGNDERDDTRSDSGSDAGGGSRLDGEN